MCMNGSQRSKKCSVIMPVTGTAKQMQPLKTKTFVPGPWPDFAQTKGHDHT